MIAEINMEVALESLRLKIKSGSLTLEQWSDWCHLLGLEVMQNFLKSLGPVEIEIMSITYHPNKEQQ